MIPVGEVPALHKVPRLKHSRGLPVRLPRQPEPPDPGDDQAVRAWLKSVHAPTAIDLFCGAGGLSVGLRDAGFAVLVGADSDATSVETHTAKIGGLGYVGDLSKPEDFIEWLRQWGIRHVDLVAGGIPCQPFSQAGRAKIRSLVQAGRRPADDERAKLWKGFLEVVANLRPRAVLLENVPDLATWDHRAVALEMSESLRELGYAKDHAHLSHFSAFASLPWQESHEALDPVNTDRPHISVIIPAMNEAQNIGWVIGRLPSIVDELILVDGRSTDATIDVARALRPDVVVVQDDGHGKGVALRAGFAAAQGDYVVMIDADGSMDPAEIPAFVARLDAGSDLVKGSRFLPGGGSADLSLLRSVGNRFLLDVANLIFGASYSELCYGYAAFRRGPVLRLELTAVGFEVETELFLRALRNGLRVDEVPSFEAPRRSGASNLNAFRDGWRILRTIVRERLRPALNPAVVERGTLHIDTLAWLSGQILGHGVPVSHETEPSAE